MDVVGGGAMKFFATIQTLSCGTDLTDPLFEPFVCLKMALCLVHCEVGLCLFLWVPVLWVVTWGLSLPICDVTRPGSPRLGQVQRSCWEGSPQTPQF